MEARVIFPEVYGGPDGTLVERHRKLRLSVTPT
jgi:hypothetical protein